MGCQNKNHHLWGGGGTSAGDVSGGGIYENNCFILFAENFFPVFAVKKKLKSQTGLKIKLREKRCLK